MLAMDSPPGACQLRGCVSAPWPGFGFSLFYGLQNDYITYWNVTSMGAPQLACVAVILVMLAWFFLFCRRR
jgi:hypothetical protein